MGLMQFDTAIGHYTKVLSINSGDAEAQSNLLDLLTSYTPKKEHQNLIQAVNQTIRNIDIKKPFQTI